MGYAIPITQGGGHGLPVYAGQRRQVGGSFFSTITRLAIPILKRLLPHLKTLGKRVGASALNIGTGLASDLVSGRAKQIPQNLRKRGRAEINQLAQDYIGQDMFTENPQTMQSGSGGVKRRKKSINMKRKQVAKKRSRTTAAAIDKDIFS